jgi:hypothetical protein
MFHASANAIGRTEDMGKPSQPNYLASSCMMEGRRRAKVLIFLGMGCRSSHGVAAKWDRCFILWKGASPPPFTLEVSVTQTSFRRHLCFI